MSEQGTYVTTNAAGHVINVEPAAPAGSRTFYNSDYRRAARMIRKMRQVKGNPYQGKADQSKVDQLAQHLAEVFNLDAHDHAVFSPEMFLAGTQLPDPAENVLPDSPPEDIADEDLPAGTFDVE